MKKIFLLLLLAASFSVKAQSLKELLYSGKLKKDSSGVIRKDDDLSSKIDTATKKPQPDAVIVPTANMAEKKQKAFPDSSAAAQTPAPVVDNGVENAPAETKNENTGAAAPVKSNNKILKDYTDSLSAALATELKDSKKIKKGTYYLTAEYEIGTDGSVEILNMFSSPENELLQGMAKERMIQSAPRLAPGLDSNNQPRKVKRKYNFMVTKD